MRTLGLFVAISLAAFLLAWAAHADDVGVIRGKGSCTLYSVEAKCRTVCKAPKPALEVLEDGLAYLLDIPLAMLSPITCPIVAPIMEELDTSPNRYYSRADKKCR